MKFIVGFFAGFLFLTACNFGKEIQVERISAELIRIDTVQRETGSFKVFTWRSSDGLTYQSLEPLQGVSIDVGTTLGMLIRR
jgi:hypothetical protein